MHPPLIPRNGDKLMHRSPKKISAEDSAIPHASRRTAGEIFARATGGAVVGALIGVVADPLTAAVGAAMCAIVSGTGFFKPDDEAG